MTSHGHGSDPLQLQPDGGEPVFAAPWEARAFAMVRSLVDAGLITRAEWADTLAGEIAASDRDDYYSAWLTALETVVVDSGLMSRDDLETCREDWRHAAAHTPHGRPIDLKRA